jgi:hypothetical protein
MIHFKQTLFSSGAGVTQMSVSCDGLDDRTIEVRTPAGAKGFFL